MKKQNGITLIALIITVILMLILTLVALSAIWDGNLFDKTQETADLYETKKEEEVRLIENLIDKIENYGSPSISYLDVWLSNYQHLGMLAFDITISSLSSPIVGYEVFLDDNSIGYESYDVEGNSFVGRGEFECEYIASESSYKSEYNFQLRIYFEDGTYLESVKQVISTSDEALPPFIDKLS